MNRAVRSITRGAIADLPLFEYVAYPVIRAFSFLSYARLST